MISPCDKISGIRWSLRGDNRIPYQDYVLGLRKFLPTSSGIYFTEEEARGRTLRAILSPAVNRYAYEQIRNDNRRSR